MPRRQNEGGVFDYFEEKEDSWVCNVKIGEAEGKKDEEAKDKICKEVLSKGDPKTGSKGRII